MFDIGFSELVVIALVALVVLGPERLPKAARLAGLWVRRARAHWYAVKSELEQELAADELQRSLRDTREAIREAGEDGGAELLGSLLLARLLHLEGEGDADEVLRRAVLAVLEVVGDVLEVLRRQLAVEVLLEFGLGLVAAAVGHLLLLVAGAGTVMPRSRA